ncbi:MAG: MFS transporter [Chlamydiae bacterium]|nr:MFS transporter [Chlamydiota bacterium]
MQPLENKIENTFTKYEVFLIAILSILMFTGSLGFMIIAPLGVKLIRSLQISPSQFGFLVSAYAFSAGISCLFSSGFSDKFDRKKFLLFFYAGFILGTFLCSVANSYQFFLIARIVTGIFGGVISGSIFAIIADVFKFQVRGRVMGFIMMAFSASQIMGIPLGLFLANKYSWHTPFIFIAIISLFIDKYVCQKEAKHQESIVS